MADKGYEKLKADLAAQTPGSVYLFHGEESYLREYYFRELQKMLLPSGMEEFNFHRLNGKEFTVQQLTECVEAMPMMSERTLVAVYDCNLYALDEKSRTALVSLLEDIPEYCCLVFIYDTEEYKPNRTYKTLYSALEKKAVTVKFERQSKNDLIRWISKHFAASGHKISAQNCEHLIFQCGELMTGLLPEISKISAYAKKEEITRQDIDAVADPIISAIAFDMTNAITAGDYNRAADVLGQMFKKQEDVNYLLAIIGKELRKIYTARIAIEEGKDRVWLMDLWGMHSDYPAKLALQAARKTTRAWCANSLKLCQKLDDRLKKERGIDGEGELKLLLMQLAQRE